MMSKKDYKTIDEYIVMFPKEIQPKLQEIRRVIKQAAPNSQEVISYRMPAFKQNGTLVWFAAFKHHIGFYPTSSAIIAFKEKLAKYKTSKGAIQFPIDQPIPLELIKEMYTSE
jgi:uncharacterized protein YdhG (YjbR/CyaY superfamily)